MRSDIFRYTKYMKNKYTKSVCNYDSTFSFYLLSLHICTLWPYSSCQMLQPVDYWQGKGQSSSLECADTHKLFNFHPQRSVVRKYWAGQRWGKYEIKKASRGSAVYFTMGFVFVPLLFFWVIIQSQIVWFWKHSCIQRNQFRCTVQCTDVP